MQRIRRYTKKPTDDTPLCSVNISGQRSKFITQANTLLSIQKTCFYHGGKARFSFHPHEIGNKSVRSGAAMALFLKHHSTDKIMLLGRWKSKAFMVYIRPQVVEWAEMFSVDMISFNNYFELCSIQKQHGAETEEAEIRRFHYDIPEGML